MTTELKARDFLLHYLKKEYSKRSKVINNLTSHVERLHKDYLLTNIKRTDHLKSINELIKLLNITYNTRLDTIKGTEKNDRCLNEEILVTEENNENTAEKIKLGKVTNLEKNLCDIIKIPKNKTDTDENKQGMLDMIYGLSFTVYEKELNNFTPNDFKIVDEKIKKIISLVGCKTISDCIMICSKGTENMLCTEVSDELSLIDTLNNSFIPLSISFKKKPGKTNIKVIKQYPSGSQDKCESLLGNFYKVELNLTNPVNDEFQICINGFFEHDCVNSNIRTSTICNKFIGNKIAHLDDIINGSTKLAKGSAKLNMVPATFKELYLKNMSIGEIIGCDDNTFVNDMLSDYVFYQKYSTLSTFKVAFTDFVSGDLLTKFKIIKYLLLGSSTGYAGVLFGSTKESKTGSLIIADIIYKNLSLELQLKLCKEGVAVKAELEKIALMDADDIDLKRQIMLNKNMPAKVKKLAIEKLNEMKGGGTEYYKQLLYVKTIMDYPWIGENDDDIFTRYKNDYDKWREIIMTAKTRLHDRVYGHAECKDTIVELLAKWFTNPKSVGTSIALQGPPGVGKSMIAMELGKALGLPFAKINLGGIEDSSIITGHSSTYSGAVPGLIVKKMAEMGAPRCILFFDELDKIALHHGRNEISDVLIHITDVTTNSKFNDKFFQDVEFPLNKVLFVFSFNNKEKIDPILLDRMEIIKVESYSIEDKINIVSKHLLKEAQEDIGINDINIKISDEMITHLVQGYTHESGVRGIKRLIEKILRKLNKDRIFKTGIFEPPKKGKEKPITSVELTRDMIEKYLPKQVISIRKIHEEHEVGTICGLWVSSYSSEGGILPIVIYKNQTGNNGKFTLKITGNQMKVMMESIEYAFTLATNIVKQKYVNKFFDHYKSGIHLHNPDSSKKDGPSAGICTTVAFVSKILNLKIKKNIAITGEAFLNGNVTEIGGLDGKSIGAKKAGVKLVLAPKENEKDLEKIKELHKTLIDDNFKIILINNLKEALEYALIEDPENYKEDMVFEKTFNCDQYLVDKCSTLQKHKIDIEDNTSESENNSDKNSEGNDSDGESESDENSSYSSDDSK